VNVSQWNLTKESDHLTGIKRYDLKIFEECSKYLTVTRYPSTGHHLKSFINYRAGDVTHITTHQFVFLKVFKFVSNCVVTVHDLTQYHWNPMKSQLRDYWALSKFFLRHADHFITDSNYTKYDLAESFNVPDEIMTTVYLGVDRTIFHPMDREKCRKMFDMKDGETYLFSISSGEPWKNTEILKKLPYNIIDIGYGRGKYGFMTDEQITALYCASDAFLCPSKAEGFGLPALEAMTCGTPVIASDMTSLPEVVGDGGILVNPDDPAE
jgi:glycosyltransferase involved in cell wall biosynthesis